MVCGTTSDSGKSTLVTGLCRLLARQGVSVAPFKAQNLSLNSFVTAEGGEIGRAQAAQAWAAGIDPEVAMNPVLFKPLDGTLFQEVVMGRPTRIRTFDAADVTEEASDLFGVALDALEELRSRFDVVLVEGAGGAAEINLLERDIANLNLAAAADIPAIVVGDIDRGGVFASLYGTVELLPPRLRRHARGFVVNKFRGDPGILAGGLADLEARCGVPTLGVVPYLPGVGIDAEDSLSLPRGRSETGAGGEIQVAVVRLPMISNFTDFEPLMIDPACTVRFVSTHAELSGSDLVVIPGTRGTVTDLDWLRRSGLAAAIDSHVGSGSVLLGICGGYQMLGMEISDPIESAGRASRGLGYLPVRTEFEDDKVTLQRRGTALGHPVLGYQIHHGRVRRSHSETESSRGMADVWLEIADTHGAAAELSAGRVFGTSLHGVFESDGFRRAFLSLVAGARNKRQVVDLVSFAEARQRRADELADLVESSMDIPRIFELIGRRPTGSGRTKVIASSGEHHDNE